MAKVIFTEQEREKQKLLNRMDRLDAIAVEYMRKYSFTTEVLSEKVGCSPSSLWRYRKKLEGFESAPFIIVCNILRLANVTNSDLRYICGLPTGIGEDDNAKN